MQLSLISVHRLSVLGTTMRTTRVLAVLLLAACCVSSQTTEGPKTPAENTTSADGVDLGDRFGHRRPGASSSQHRPNGGGYHHGGSGEHYGGSSSGGGGGYHHQGSHESQKKHKLQLEYGWKKMDFAFHSDAERRNAVRSGTYNYTKIIPLDVDIWEKGE